MRLPYWLLWLALLLQRLAELRRSRANAAGIKGSLADPEGYPLMVTVHVGLFVFPVLESRLTHASKSVAGTWAAVLLTAAVLRLSSIHALSRQWNVRGLVPADLHPVTSGPYRFIRHPNYLAVAVEVAALPLATGAWRSAIGLTLANTWVLRRRIRAEERLLFANPDYRRAFTSKRRFIPGVL